MKYTVNELEKILQKLGERANGYYDYFYTNTYRPQMTEQGYYLG